MNSTEEKVVVEGIEISSDDVNAMRLIHKKSKKVYDWVCTYDGGWVLVRGNGRTYMGLTKNFKWV